MVTPFSARHNLRGGGRRDRAGRARRRGRAARAAGDRHRRVRPGAGRRPGRRLGDPDRRRSRHRQVDPAAPGRCEGRRARPCRRLYFRRGGGRPGAPARAPARARRGAAAARRGDLGARHPDHARRMARRPLWSSIDSIQTMYSDLIEGAPGTVSQVRAAAARADPLRQGSGRRARPGRPRHQGRRDRRPARARAYGRHGAELRGRAQPPIPDPARDQEPLSAAPTRSACSRWARRGSAEVANPSALFLTHRGEAVPGAVVFPALEGTRPVLVEIQALTVRLASGATPRRAAVGWDSGRLAMILAVLEARCGLSFSTAEVYLNVAGGYRITDPAADLAVAAALVSALAERPVAARDRRVRRSRAVGRAAPGRPMPACASRKRPSSASSAPWSPPRSPAEKGPMRLVRLPHAGAAR